MKLWCVGEFEFQTDYGVIWKLRGVFDNEEVARKTAKNINLAFVAPAELNTLIPVTEEGRWEGLEYVGVAKCEDYVMEDVYKKIKALPDGLMPDMRFDPYLSQYNPLYHSVGIDEYLDENEPHVNRIRL